MRVPVLTGDKPWGSVELCFAQPWAHPMFGFLGHPLAALANGGAGPIFDKLRQEAEFVVVDASAILPVADTRFVRSRVAHSAQRNGGLRLGDYSRRRQVQRLLAL